MLITRAGAAGPPGFEVFRRRLEGVLVARTYVMMDYDIREPTGSSRRVALTPGHREPDHLAAASRGLGRGARDGARATAPSG